MLGKFLGEKMYELTQLINSARFPAVASLFDATWESTMITWAHEQMKVTASKRGGT